MLQIFSRSVRTANPIMGIGFVTMNEDVGRQLKEYVAHDVKAMMPMLQRMKAAIERSGDREIALTGMFERTACFYQLCLDLESSPGRRTFTFPFSHVLEVSRRIGQFDLTNEEMHEHWLKARLLGYAEVLGVKISVSDIGADGKVTVALV